MPGALKTEKSRAFAARMSTSVTLNQPRHRPTTLMAISLEDKIPPLDTTSNVENGNSRFTFTAPDLIKYLDPNFGWDFIPKSLCWS